MYTFYLLQMPNLPHCITIECKVVDLMYCGVVVDATNSRNEKFNFAIELFPQNDKQNTKPVDDTKATEAYPDRSNVVMAEALAYWISAKAYNADGTPKSGSFAEANLSLKKIPIGAILYVTIVNNTKINTEVMVQYGDDAPFKAYACAKPSPQFAVDTYIICLFNGELYIRLIQRAAAGPDFPSAWAIIGGFLDGGMTVDQVRLNEMMQEGGIVRGDNRVIVIELGERNEHGREPRYMPFSYMNRDGKKVTFGCERGSTANAALHLVIPNDASKLPHLAKATDEAEVVKGEWVKVKEFLKWGNNPANIVAGHPYVAWRDHQKGALAAVEKLCELKLVELKLDDLKLA
jgi:hypothetical protein